MESPAHEPTPVHALPPPSLGDGEQPPIDAIFDAGEPGAGDQTVVTHVTCEHCGTKASWRGDITADMLERTFTRGVNEQSGLPNCPRCGHELALDHVEPVESAIETAARELPERSEERRQLTIPGIHPPFDFEAGMRSILEQRAVVRRAEAIAESKHRDATKARKDAESEQSQLSELEDKFADRVEELENEAALTPEQRAERQTTGCSWEALTGTPCRICRSAVANHSAFNGNPAHVAAVTVLQARSDDGVEADALSAAIKTVANLAIDVETVDTWTGVERLAVASWLEVPTVNPRPEVLGRAHVVSATAGSCEACGTLLTPLAGAFGLEAWPVGQLIGTDCEGEPAKAARTPRKRHATKEARQRARQVATREERAVQAKRQETSARAQRATKTVQKATRKTGKRGRR